MVSKSGKVCSVNHLRGICCCCLKSWGWRCTIEGFQGRKTRIVKWLCHHELCCASLILNLILNLLMLDLLALISKASQLFIQICFSFNFFDYVLSNRFRWHVWDRLKDWNWFMQLFNLLWKFSRLRYGSRAFDHSFTWYSLLEKLALLSFKPYYSRFELLDLLILFNDSFVCFHEEHWVVLMLTIYCLLWLFKFMDPHAQLAICTL